MADFLGGLLSGGGGLYDDLLTPQQQSQLSSRGLLSMAGAFADAAMPSRLPVPLGAAIGKAAAAMSGGRDEAALKLLQGQKLAQEVQTMKITSALQQQFMKDIQTLPLDVLFKRYGIGAGGVPAAAGPSTSPLPAAPNTAPLPAVPNAGPAAPAAVPPAGGVPGDLGPAAGEYGAWSAPTGARLAPAGPVPTGMPGPSTPPTGLLGPAPSLPPGDVPPPEPPLKESSLGAPDTVLPSGPGGLLATPAMYGGGAGTPSFGPGGEATPTVRLAASSGQPSDPRGLIPYIRERATALGIDPDVAVRVAQSEGLGTFRSSVIQRDGQREPSFGAFQLYTGGGMGNDFQRDTGLDPSDPKNERATIDYALNKAPSTGWTPWHGAAGAGLGPRTGLPGGPDYVIPSGRGVPANMLQQVADKGGAPGAPAVPVPPGVDPQGMNTLLLELAKRNAMAEILKLGNPYSSMLNVLQGSPEYKAQIETATRGAGLPFIRKEAEEKAIGGYGVDIATRTYQAGLDAANKEKEQIGAAARDLTTVNLPDANGNLIERQVTRAQAIDIAHGLPVPELGFKGMYGAGVGKPVLTPGQQASDTEMAQTSVKDYRAANDAARMANGRIQQYGQMAQAAQGFTSGPNAERWYALKSQLKDLGWIKGTDVPDMEVFQNAARKMQVIAAPKGQGGVSNYERELFASTVPQIVTSPEGLAKAIDIARRLDEYDVKVAGIHRDVAQSNRGRPDSLAADARIAALGPPITPEEMQALDALRSPGGAPAAAPAATAPAAAGAPRERRWNPATNRLE